MLRNAHNWFSAPALRPEGAEASNPSRNPAVIPAPPRNRVGFPSAHTSNRWVLVSEQPPALLFF